MHELSVVTNLAQKIGLVEAPKPGLTESDWKLVKHISQNRGDSTQPCVICKEDFDLREQVWLFINDNITYSFLLQFISSTIGFLHNNLQIHK